MPQHPGKKNSKEHSIAKFMNSDKAKKDFPDKKKRLAAAMSKFKELDESKETTVMFEVVKVKETEKGKRYTFVGANTLPDRARGRTTSGELVDGEILAKSFLDKVASLINNENSSDNVCV